MNIHRRLELLEQQLTSEPIVLLMPDGHTETLRGDLLDLFSRAVRGNAGDGTDRSKRKLYRAGRCAHDRLGAGAFERTKRGFVIARWRNP